MTSSSHSNERRHCLFYLQPYFSALGTVVPKSLTGALSSNSRLDICSRSVSEIYKSIIEIIWDEVFMVRNTVRNGQS